jgi:hypothetical protein
VTAPPASPRRWRGGPLRRPATRFPGGVDGPRREARTRECGGESFWSAQADRWPKAPGGRIHSACRPTVGRRLLCRLKSAFQGADAPGVGLRRRGACFFGRRRPTVGRRPLEAEFIRRAGRRPKALCRLKSAFEGADAPGVGLRRRGACFFGRRRPTVGRRPPEAEFIRRAGRRPKALCRLKSAFQGAVRRASAFADAERAFSVGAGRPSAEGPGGRIHSACRPTEAFPGWVLWTRPASPG